MIFWVDKQRIGDDGVGVETEFLPVCKGFQIFTKYFVHPINAKFFSFGVVDNIVVRFHRQRSFITTVCHPQRSVRDRIRIREIDDISQESYFFVPSVGGIGVKRRCGGCSHIDIVEDRIVVIVEPHLYPIARIVHHVILNQTVSRFTAKIDAVVWRVIDEIIPYDDIVISNKYSSSIVHLLHHIVDFIEFDDEALFLVLPLAFLPVIGAKMTHINTGM